MKITIQAKTFPKPILDPQMIMKQKVSQASTNMELPPPSLYQYPALIEKKEEAKKENLISSFFSNLKLAQTKHVTYLITPVPSTKNDKNNMLIESFSNTHQEMYQTINHITFNQNGLYIPKQNKFFFETVIGKNHFKQYATTNIEQEEFVKQQLDFVFFKSPVTKQEDDIFNDLNINHAVAYEYKLKHSPVLGLSTDGRLQERPLKDYLELSKTMLEGERIIIQFGMQPSESDWYKGGEKAYKDLPKRIKEGTNSRKLGYNGYDCVLRMIVIGQSEGRSELIARGYKMALSQLNEENELVADKISNKKFKKWFCESVLTRKIKTPLSFNKRFILTHKEIANFIKLPQRNIQTEYELKVNEKEQSTIPKQLRQNGIYVGQSDEKSKAIPISIPTNNKDHLCGTYAFIGGMGSGKDFSVAQFVIEAANKGFGAIIPDVIDEKGRGCSDLIRQNVSEDRIIDIDLTDLKYAIYFGFDDVVSLMGSADILANDLVKILELDDKYESKMLARLLAKATNCNLYDMYSCLRSYKFALKVKKKLMETDKLLGLQFQKEFIERKISPQITGAVLTRLDEILGFKLTKNMFCQEPNDKFNLTKWIDDNKVVIVRMRKAGGLGELGSRLLLNLLLLKVFWIKKIKPTQNVTFLLLNEFHQYLNDAIKEIISDMMFECRKYRLSLLLVFHTPERIGKSLWENIQAGSTNYFLFKTTSNSIYRHMGEHLKPLDIETCMKTEKYESIYLPYVDGKTFPPVFVKMAPPVNHDEYFRVGNHTPLYATPIDEVNEYIYNRELQFYEEDEEY